MNNGLSDYAIAHLRMADIGKRFERVIERHPRSNSSDLRWRARMARDSARYQFQQFPIDLKMADYVIHRRFT